MTRTSRVEANGDDPRTRPIRIFYVIDNLAFRGGERTTLQLAQRLDRRRFQLSVGCSPGGLFVDRLRELEVSFVPVEMRRNWRLDSVLTLARALEDRRPDIVHTQGRGDPFGRTAARLAGVPAVVSTVAAIAGRYQVDAIWRKALYRAIDRLTDPLVDRFIAVNPSSVAVLVERHRVARDRIAIIPNGIEIDRFDPDRSVRGDWRSRHGIPLDAHLIGGLGRLTWEKGFGDLIRAAAPRIERGSWLVIAGEGPNRARLQALAEELGIQERCRLVGFVEDVPAFLADLDLFVLSSRIEGHPMVLLEAMAMARPVIATAVPGATDTISDGVDGCLVPVGDVDALARAIEWMPRDPAHAAVLGRNARRTVTRTYTADRMVRRTAALYARLAGSPTPTEHVSA